MCKTLINNRNANHNVRRDLLVFRASARKITPSFPMAFSCILQQKTGTSTQKNILKNVKKQVNPVTKPSHNCLAAGKTIVGLQSDGN